MPSVKRHRLSARERRGAIVAAAQPLFASHGFDAVTTRDVAAAAEVSEALLYRHFAGKAELYEAVRVACLDRITADAGRVERLPDDTGTLVVALYLVMRNIAVRQTSDQEDVARLTLRSLLEDGAFARSFVKWAASHWIGKVERCIRAAIAAKDVRTSFRDALAGYWFGHDLAVGMLSQSLPRRPVVPYPIEDRSALLDASVLFALRGMGLTEAAIARHYRPEAFAALATTST